MATIQTVRVHATRKFVLAGTTFVAVRVTPVTVDGRLPAGRTLRKFSADRNRGHFVNYRRRLRRRDGPFCLPRTR